ncbi:MAG TPA: hypothetical protein PLZ43_08080 [bacterium]|nr:hypothetical protein [bacterium]
MYYYFSGVYCDFDPLSKTWCVEIPDFWVTRFYDTKPTKDEIKSLLVSLKLING